MYGKQNFAKIFFAFLFTCLWRVPDLAFKAVAEPHHSKAAPLMYTDVKK
jgi:hypothetical protein